jgi:alpha-tubulin suppressor-like RCC1 family protein
VGTLTGVAFVAGGRDHGLAVLGDGTVRAWGANTYGQLGDGTTTRRTSPVTVPGLSGVETVTAGRAYSAAL